MSEEKETKNEDETAKSILSEAGRCLVEMIAHMFRGRGRMFLPGIAILIAMSFVTRHPAFVVITVLVLIRGYLALVGETSEES